MLDLARAARYSPRTILHPTRWVYRAVAAALVPRQLVDAATAAPKRRLAQTAGAV